MIWHYRCPSCSQQLEANWDWHREEVTCPQCRNRHYPPTPHEDRHAWFGGDKWPQEMADAVVAVRGTTCAVPGCYQAYDVMVHRKPMAKGGHTSVDNLLPMCTRHARLKGGQLLKTGNRIFCGSVCYLSLHLPEEAKREIRFR